MITYKSIQTYFTDVYFWCHVQFIGSTLKWTFNGAIKQFWLEALKYHTNKNENFALWKQAGPPLVQLWHHTRGVGHAPYLASLLHNYSPPQTMHSSSAKLLTVPRHNLSLGSRAFCIFAPTTWNSLSQIVRDCSSLASFRNHLKTHYFSSAFSTLCHLIHMRLNSNLTTALYKSFTYLLTYLLTYLSVQCMMMSTTG